MSEVPLPANVYRLPQRRFDAIPGAPWVYWVSDDIRRMFENLSNLGQIAYPKHGMSTGKNARFVRYSWEIGRNLVVQNCVNRTSAAKSGKRWFPYMKGGGYRKWYGNQDFVVNYWRSASEMQAGRESGEVGGHRHDNPDYYFRQGITYSYLTSGSFSVRLMPTGFVFDVAGSSIFPPDDRTLWQFMSILNSTWARYALRLINPTVNFQVGDLARLPLSREFLPDLERHVHAAVRCQRFDISRQETSFDFIYPSRWSTGITNLGTAEARLASIESSIDDEVYRLYGISDADRVAIDAELAGGVLDPEDGEGDEAPDGRKREEFEEEATAGAMTHEELAVRWISYAVGVVLGRFRAGADGALGRAVCRRDDFAVGSLPAPDEAEFDELVGPVERFAYVDAAGGRHVFPAEVEQALADLALPDGIAVLDEGHPRDLPALVEKALRLMLDGAVKREDVMREDAGHVSRFTQHASSQADDVIAAGANGDLRKFLEKDFFTKWHLKWYRKRPVYWPLQSARRGYGFVLFHEKVEKYTLYVLLRDYLDHKLNGLRLQIEDLLALTTGQSGAARRQTERQLDRARQLLDEVNVFAQAIDRIAKGGYQPEANWIDDGVILRLAPLWELIPIWKAEPKKYWERLEGGDYDWSHIAMAYWPARVRAACRTNKSFAIAHGHEEWYKDT